MIAEQLTPAALVLIAQKGLELAARVDIPLRGPPGLPGKSEARTRQNINCYTEFDSKMRRFESCRPRLESWRISIPECGGSSPSLTHTESSQHSWPRLKPAPTRALALPVAPSRGASPPPKDQCRSDHNSRGLPPPQTLGKNASPAVGSV